MALALNPSATVTAPMPAAGASINVESIPGGKIELGFDPGTATASRSGNDLVFAVDGGGTVTLTDFFVVGDEALPSLVMPDGLEVAAADYLASFDMDLSTAAGPAAGPGNPSSGSGEYGDDAGNLLAGVTRIGALGTDQWGRGTEIVEDFNGLLGPIPAISITPIIPGQPGTPGQPIDPDDPSRPTYYIAADGFNLLIDESVMPGGTNDLGGEVAPVYALSFRIESNDGLASISIDGVSYTVSGGTLVGFPADGIPGDNGTLFNPSVVDNGDGVYTLSFSYQQNSPVGHEDGDGKNMADNVDSWEIGVSSLSGASDSLTANVDIIDDIPTLTVYDGEGNLVGPDFAPVGEWENLHFGYDGEAEEGGLLINGKPATYTDGIWSVEFEDGSAVELRSDGSVWYKHGEAVDEAVKITLDIQAVDGDGDVVDGAADGTGIEFWVVNSPKDIESLTDDSALANGTVHPDDGSATCTILASALGDGWEFDQDATLPTHPNGTFSLDADGNLVFTQTSAYGHTEGDNEHDNTEDAGTVTVTVVHPESGETREVTLTVTISDDGPVLNAATDPTVTLAWEQAADGSWSIDPEVGSVIFDMGADGYKEGSLVVNDGTNDLTLTDGAYTYADGSVLSVSYEYGTDGKLTVSYEYTPGINSPAERAFTFTAEDGDGDSISESVTIAYDPESAKPSVGSGTALVSETDIAGQLGVLGDTLINAGTDAGLAAENLDGTTGIVVGGKENEASYEGQLSSINYGPSGPSATAPFTWDIPGEEFPMQFMVNGAYQPVPEGGWALSAGGTVLTATIDGQDVLVLKYTGDGAYTVEIKAAVQHDSPDDGVVADYNRDHSTDASADPGYETAFEFGFTIVNGDDQTAEGVVSVVVQDDILDFGPDGVSGVSMDLESYTEIFYTSTDVLNLNGYNDADYMSQWGLTFEAKKAVLNADGTVKYLTDLPGGTVVHSTKDLTNNRGHDPYEPEDGGASVKGNGIGIKSTNNGGRGSDTEIEFVRDGAGTGTHSSEALVISLPEGKVSFGVTIDFNLIFTPGAAGDARAEIAIVTLYRDGKIVGSYEVTADSALGNYKSQFSVEGGFDQIVITASDGASPSNNSDFTVGGLQFHDVTVVEYITANIAGAVEGGGADGIDLATLTFMGVGEAPQSYALVDGNTLSVSVTESGRIIGTIVDGEGTVVGKAFDVYMDAQGNWDYLQYQHFDIVGDNDVLRFDFSVQDNDGDYVNSYLNVPVPEMPVPAEAGADSLVYVEDDGTVLSVAGVLENDADFVRDSETNDAVTGVQGQAPGTYDEGTHEFTVTGEYGTLYLNAETGEYRYELATNGNGQAENGSLRDYFGSETTAQSDLADTFTYTVKGADGKDVTETITINFQNSVFEEGTNGADTISGGAGHDALVGDLGGASDAVYAAYNVALVVDTSGSMTNMSYVKTALNELAAQLKEVGADENTVVNIALIGFESKSSLKLTISDFDSQTELDALLNAIKNLSATGGTNYESAFLHAATWFNGQDASHDFGTGTADYKNVMYFITDGKPTYHVQDSYTPSSDYPSITISNWEPGETLNATSGNRSSRIDADGNFWTKNGSAAWTKTGTTIFDLYDGNAGSTTNTKDTSDALATWTAFLKNQGVEVNTIGLGSGVSLGDLNPYDNTGGAVVITSTGNQLKEDLARELIESGSIDWKAVAGSDVISGGDGNDVIFGDAMTADWLLDADQVKELGLDSWNPSGNPDCVEGGSWAIVQEYVKQTYDPDTQSFNDALREFVTENAVRLGQSEDHRGNADIILGDAGDDVIFGQGGDDVVYGGAGNDVIYGGTGADILHGGTGADTFAWTVGDLDGSTDTIKDFSLAEADKLDISDLFPDGADTISLDDLLAGYVSVKELDAESNTLTLEVTHGEDKVTVEVNFQGGELQAFADNYTGDNMEQALLQQMIAGVAG